MVDLIKEHLHFRPSTHTFTEAVVLFDYGKEQDDELNLKVGDITDTDMEQVCEQYLYPDFHMGINMLQSSCLKQCKLSNTCSKKNTETKLDPPTECSYN